MPRNLAARRKRIQQAISELTVGAQRRYPAQLRSRIAAYSRERIKAGIPLTRVSSELGVSHPTLVRILEERPAPMRRVRVARPQATKAEPRAALVVRGPAGLVFEGLDVEGVAALVRVLS
jgi:hypothetical protein